ETGLRFAGRVEIAGLDARPHYRRADKLLEQGREMFAGLAGSQVSRWMGHPPCLPDSVPMIGPSTPGKNTYLACGHGHIGLTCDRNDRPSDSRPCHRQETLHRPRTLPHRPVLTEIITLDSRLILSLHIYSI